MVEKFEAVPSQNEASALHDRIMATYDEEKRLGKEMDRAIAASADRAEGEREALEEFGPRIDEMRALRADLESRLKEAEGNIRDAE